MEDEKVTKRLSNATKLASTLLVMALASSAIHAEGWRRPDGHLDPNSKYTNETRAYDGNSSSYA
jgi:hypothetical protein